MIALILGIAILGLFFGAMIWLGRSVEIPVDAHSAELIRDVMATLKDERLALVLSRRTERFKQERMVPNSFRRG